MKISADLENQKAFSVLYTPVPISPTNQAIQRLVVKIVLVNPRARYRLRTFVDATEPQYSLLICETFNMAIIDHF